MKDIIKLDTKNILREHICCAISDKKCTDSYHAKKDWLSKQFDNGYVFRRINARAKVFIEYGSAENAWIPITAPNYVVSARKLCKIRNVSFGDIFHFSQFADAEVLINN